MLKYSFCRSMSCLHFQYFKYTQSKAEINSKKKKKKKGQRDHTIILIAHFYPNRSFLELVILHHESVFKIHHIRKEKERGDIRKY